MVQSSRALTAPHVELGSRSMLLLGVNVGSRRTAKPSTMARKSPMRTPEDAVRGPKSVTSAHAIACLMARAARGSVFQLVRRVFT